MQAESNLFRIQNLLFVLLVPGWIACCLLPAAAADSGHPAHPRQVADHAVASAHPLATRAGIEVLEQGGNAFDAAVAVTAALAVVEPYSSGLGGGGFWLLHTAADQRDIMLDGRETAPLAATRDMYLDSAGNPTRHSVAGPLAAGIPGVPAAIVHLSRNYGRLPLAATLQAAIRLAREGFTVSSHYRRLAVAVMDHLRESHGGSAVFLDRGVAPDAGFRLKQPQLARVLERIRDEGADGFYRGEVARQLVEGVRQAGGIWQLRDLQQYQVKERRPVSGAYGNLKITSAALPSSGGIVLIQMFNMLSLLDLSQLDGAHRTHAVVEAMRRAYMDRARYLGDPDYVEVPVQKLLSRLYADEAFADFNPRQASSSRRYLEELEATGDLESGAGRHTTHFSVIDREGNYVAATLSINYPFGSGFVPPGTGVLLNNEMDDFVIKPAHPNLYGLIGGRANAIEPGKRMLSSMSPTFLDDGRRIAILGTPGGSRIITMVLLAALEFSSGGDAHDMVALPRFHHQFVPDRIQFESGAFDPETQATLVRLGHALESLQRRYGNMHVVIWDRTSGRVTAASDPRGIGSAQAGR